MSIDIFDTLDEFPAYVMAAL